MIIWYNQSPSWLSTELPDDPDKAGIITDALPYPPPGIDDPNIKPEVLRYDTILIDSNELAEYHHYRLIGKKAYWNNKTWVIEGVDMYYVGDDPHYTVAIREDAEGNAATPP